MSGVAIGKRLNHGYIGQPSRTDDTIIESRTADGSITFGAPVKITSDNKVKAIGAGDAATAFFGFAMREVMQSSDYSTGASAYQDKDPVDIMVRGTMLVKVNSGTPTPHGKVYIRVANGTSDKPIGGIEAVADSTSGNTIELTGVVFNTGKLDANKVAEVLVQYRH